MLSNMNEKSILIIGENSDASKNIEELDKDKADGGNLLSQCLVAYFSKVVSFFSIDQQVAVKEIGFGSLLELKCGRLRQKLCAKLVEQSNIVRNE